MPVSAAPATTYTPRSIPAPAPTYTPSERSVSRSFPQSQARETPAPQARATPAPRAVADTRSASPWVRTGDAPRTAAVSETPARTVTDAAAARVKNADGARNSGTTRGGFQTRTETALPAAPAVTRRAGESPASAWGTPRASDPALPAAPSVTRRAGESPASAWGTPRASDPALPAAPSVTRRAGESPASAWGTRRASGPVNTALKTPAASRGTATMNFGSGIDNTRWRQPAAGLSLNPARRTEDLRRDGSAAATGRGSSAFTARPDTPSAERSAFSSSRYRDGRSSVYRAPERSGSAERHADYHPQPVHHDSRDGGHHPSYYRYPPQHYSHHAFAPVWYGPVVYPAGNYFGFSWNNDSFGLSFGYSSAAYYPRTRYYDSWACGGWGYSGVYYGGWRDNWYGGFSYVYNPWPVYRTYYLYEPAPVVVTRTETVYVTQPAATTYVVQDAAPATVVLQPPATVAYPPPPEAQTAWDAAPAAERTETVSAGCFCPCHCNGQRPCTCAYPCGAEYAFDASQFDLSLGYTPYAETLNPETIWSSYAGLDRRDAYLPPNLFDATASTESDRR